MKNMSSTMSSRLRTVVNLWYLGGKITFIFQNLHQPIMTLYPLLSYYLPKDGERIFGQALGMTWNSRYRNQRRIERSAKQGDELANILLRLMREGVLKGTLSNEFMLVAYRSSKMLQFLNAAAILSEHANWKVGAIAGYLAGKKLGLKEEELYDFIVKLDQEANFVYGTMNLPLGISRQRGAIRSLNLFIYQFRTWIQNYWLIARQFGKGRPDVFLKLLGVLLFIGGVSAFPMMRHVKNLIKKIWGVDLENESYRHLDKRLARALWHGTESAMLGVDLSGLIGFGDVVMTDTPTDILDLAAGGGIIKKLGYASQLAGEGQSWRAWEAASPKAISNVLQGIRWQHEGGVRDLGGELIKPTSTSQNIKKMMGFTPIEVAENYEIRRQLQELRSQRNAAIGRINNEFAQGIYRGNDDRIDRAIEIMDNWNKKYPDMPIALDKTSINRQLNQMLGNTSQNYPKAMRPIRLDLESLITEE